MRISDWSSDVCSSDLLLGGARDERGKSLRNWSEHAAGYNIGSERGHTLFGMNVECAKCPLQPPTRRGKELELLGQTIAGECSLTGRERWIYLEDVERSEEHTSELQSLMRNQYAVFH